MLHTRLRRAVPLGAAALAATAIAAPAYGAGGVAAPGGEVIYNTASITLSTFPVGATPITVSRDGTVIANATANVDGTGLANLNVAGIVAPEPLDCWTGFTPEILPGDVITIGGAAGTTITAPNFTVERPTQVGSDLIFHGSAADAAGNPMAADALLVSKTPRFSTGGKGGQTLAGALSFDAAGTSAFTARFAGLTAGDMALGLGSATAEVATIPPAGGAVGGPAAMTIAADNPGVPGPVAGCSAPLGRNAVTGATTKTINAANATTALVLSGVADPNVKAVSLNIGGLVFPATMAGGTWTATINPSNLPEGTLTAAATYTNGAGSFHGVTMNLVKDTVAPAAPTAGIAAGTYDTARNVALSAEPGASIHYTIDGSDPTANSRTADAVPVNQTETLKAVAVDKAGNVSPVASFDYVIAPPQVVTPAPQPVPVVTVPSLRIESLTLNRSIRLRTARKSGITAIVYAPEGAKVAKIRILRGHKVIASVMRTVSRDGVLQTRVPSDAKTRRALRRGVYRVEFQVGQSPSHLGTVLARSVRVR